MAFYISSALQEPLPFFFFLNIVILREICEMYLVLPVMKELGSSVNIVSDYGLGDRGLIPDRGR
jgi:hypothetical protein